MILAPLARRIWQPTSIAPLITFRIVFGALMLFSTLRFILLGWIDDHYVNTKFQFTYFGFEWVRLLFPEGMYALFGLMVLASVGVMLGWYYRLSAIVLFLTFTYVELIDLTYYLNHYYFVTLVLAVLIFLPAHKRFSVDARRNGKSFTHVPAWTINGLKFQIALVYMFAGLAKLNSDWLIHALPMRIWLPAADTLPIIGPVLALPAMPVIFSWLGMLYDCTIPFLLLVKKTRPWAFVSVVVFHLMTGYLFQIGVFPLVMIGSALIFFSSAWHERLVNKMKNIMPGNWLNMTTQVNDVVLNRGTLPVITNIGLSVYIAFQLLFPWRYLLYPGNLFWTEEGYRFSWRVMLVEKAGTATFYVRDGSTGNEGAVVNREFLSDAQERQMAYQPDMILQFAKFLKSHYESQGIHVEQVRAEVYVTLNARPSQLLINPHVDLTSLVDNWQHKEWLLPLRP